MRLAVVLGAGGLVGVAHHIGAVKALSEQLGLSDDRIDVLVGTSAGSVVAAYLRSGYDPKALADSANRLVDAAPTGITSHPVELVRRGVGSAYVLARSLAHVPHRVGQGERAMPRRPVRAGLFSMDAGSDILERELPSDWPERELWLSTYDLVTRRRVVLGEGHAPDPPLPTAVQASCAIPGLYPPVSVGDAVLVDGAAWSLNSMDLVLRSGATHAIAVAPMTFDPSRPPDRPGRILRALPTRLFLRDVARLRRHGVDVLALAPGPREVATEGVNLMRSSGLERVAEVAYAETSRHLGENGEAQRWRALIAS